MQEIIINEVGPRDGLQSQPKILSVEQRLSLIDALIAADLSHIEVGAFVSPKAVPAMAGAAEIMANLGDRKGEFSVLIPNLRGYQMAVESGAKTVAMVLYGSDGFAQKNVRMSRLEAQQQTQQILEQASADNVEVIATISTAFECPFDGPTDPAIVEELTGKLIEWGAQVVVLGDTIGSANPRQVTQLLQRLGGQFDIAKIGCHFHDTRAMGLANVYASVEAGVRRFDASIAGLGGCPFAPGATGNVATEDVVMLLNSMGFTTNIDMPKLIAASDLAEELTGTAPGGRAKPWLKPNIQKML